MIDNVLVENVLAIDFIQKLSIKDGLYRLIECLHDTHHPYHLVWGTEGFR